MTDKIKNTSEFQKDCPEVYDFVSEILKEVENENKISIIVNAPVKSGKRIMVECLKAMTTNLHGKCEVYNKEAVHFFITSHCAIDCKDQEDELKKYGIETCKARRNKEIVAVGKNLEAAYESKKYIIVHFDESDYGTGKDQKMDNSKIFEKIIDKANLIIFYSATNQEITYSEYKEICKFKRMKYKEKKFIPNKDYRGAKWFLENDLVVDAESFWDENKKDLTSQGKECLDLFAKSDKKIAILRLSGGDGNIGGDRIYNKCKTDESDFRCRLCDYWKEKNSGVDLNLQFRDFKNGFNWGKRKASGGGKLEWEYWVESKDKQLLVINQVCSRSTEVGFHEHISFWHDYRKDSCHNTIIQAALRVAHYHDEGHKIYLYANKEYIEVEAGVKDPKDILDYNMSPRITTIRIKNYSEGDKWFLEKYKDIPSDKGIKAKKKPEGYGSKTHNQFKSGYNEAESWLRTVYSGKTKGKDVDIILTSPSVHIEDPQDKAKEEEIFCDICKKIKVDPNDYKNRIRKDTSKPISDDNINWDEVLYYRAEEDEENKSENNFETKDISIMNKNLIT